jgi:hypothetical protein
MPVEILVVSYKLFGACCVQPAALTTCSIDVMQLAALAARIIFKYFHATEQHFASSPKWRHTVRIIAYASMLRP